jgi:uncharacterized protein (DUF2141 family)
MRRTGIMSALALAAAVVSFAAQGSRYSLKVNNTSSYDIHRLYLSSSDVETWGSDQLGTRVLKSGATFTVTDVRTGEYDIKVVDQDGDACVLRKIKIVDDVTWNLTNEALLRCEGFARTSRYSLAIQNDSRYDIQRIYVSSSRDQSWGPDQLGTQILRSGATFTINNISAGEYDLKFVDRDGDSCVLKNVNVARNITWNLTNEALLRCEGFARTSGYSLAIQNDSRYDIHRIYMSSSRVQSWGPDQLGTRVLRSGATFTINNVSAGEYDLKFVDRDGDSCVLRKIKISKNTSWTLTTAFLLKCEGYSGRRR